MCRWSRTIPLHRLTKAALRYNLNSPVKARSRYIVCPIPKTNDRCKQQPGSVFHHGGYQLETYLKAKIIQKYSYQKFPRTREITSSQWFSHEIYCLYFSTHLQSAALISNGFISESSQPWHSNWINPCYDTDQAVRSRTGSSAQGHTWSLTHMLSRQRHEP